MDRVAGCYAEDVFDKNGIKKATILFDKNCNLLSDANNYLRELRITNLSSYNSINRVALDLCYFYNFLNKYKLEISKLTISDIKNFIKHLESVEKQHHRYSIEKSIASESCKDEINNKVVKLYDDNKLSVRSRERIVNRAFLYLIELDEHEIYLNKKLINKIDTSKKRARILKVNGLRQHKDEEGRNIKRKLLTIGQIAKIKEAASTKNDYQRLLYLILERTGLRAGEALGLKIIETDLKDIRNIKGDIEYKDDGWEVTVVNRRDNPNDSLAKGQASRSISIKNSDMQEFEMALERYLKFRARKLKDIDNNWLFINNRGNKLTHNTAYKRFKLLIDKVFSGCLNHKTLHSYRHSFCTQELLDGTPIEAVAKLAGHGSPYTTYRIYIHAGGAEMRELRERYGKDYNNKRY